MTRILPTAALALFLTGCPLSSCTRPVINTVALPESATKDTPVPDCTGTSNRSVGVCAVESRAGLLECNADKATIREAIAP